MKSGLMRIFAALLAAAMGLSLLAGCGGSNGNNADGRNDNADNSDKTDDNADSSSETEMSGKSSGVAYLTEDGELMLLKDLDGSGEAICLSTSGGTFAENNLRFTNAPAESTTMPAAVFSKDGTMLYYLTDISENGGTLYCADVMRLDAGSDRNEDYLSKLSTDVFTTPIMCGDGAIYTATKNGSISVYYYDGSRVDELFADVKNIWLTDNGKSAVVWTSEGALVYFKFGKEDFELIPFADNVWYDGGDVIYCLIEETSDGTDRPGTDGKEEAPDYDYDRNATDESSSGYEGNVGGQLFMLTLDGKSELLLEEVYSVEGLADGKLYYTLRYKDLIRLSNLVENVESLNRELLYVLDHNYLEDVRYELWCCDGKDSNLICSDYYGNTRGYDRCDYYRDLEDAVYLLLQSSYAISSDFLTHFWDKLDGIERLCSRYGIEGAEELAETLSLAVSGESGDYSLIEDYSELLNDSDMEYVLEKSALKHRFYADNNIVVYTRAIKNDVPMFPPQSWNKDMLENEYWSRRCGINPFIISTSYTLANGESGTIVGLDPRYFLGVLNNNKTLVFFDDICGTLSAYTAGTNECVLTVEEASYAAISRGKLYYYEGSDLLCYDGNDTAVLAQNVYAADCAAWVYADGITLALSNVADGEGTLRIHENGTDTWIADDVSYYQRITDKEIIYISDGDLYLHMIGGETVNLADDVAGVYGAYYAGTLVGYKAP